MNILALSNSPHIGGGNSSLVLLGRGLSCRRVGVRVVVPQSGPMADACRRYHLPYELFSAEQPSWRAPGHTWRSFRKWSRLLRESRAQLVHANDILTARSISIAAWRRNVPVVCHVRFPPETGAIAWTFRRLPRPAAFIFNSRALQAECGDDVQRACPRSHQVVIHNAVDLDQYVPGPRQSPGPRVGILANLLPVKGHQDFLRMARLLEDRRFEAEYWLIGDDVHDTGLRAELERLCRELDLGESVKFLGHRSDVPQLLNELDVVVCASHVEPFGRCLIEAMACEKPVVATRVGGIPEVVLDGVTGILAPPRAPEALAAAVQRLLEDESLRLAMGKAGRRRAVECFSADTHVTRMLEIYHSVVRSD